MNPKSKIKKRIRRRKRIRAKIKGTADVPRLSVFRSNRNIWCQLIDDEKGKTIIDASSKELDKKDISGSKKIEIASKVGELIAKKGKDKKIEKVVFDRGGYQYHGRVKALAEGARKGGLKF